MPKQTIHAEAGYAEPDPAPEEHCAPVLTDRPARDLTLWIALALAAMTFAVYLRTLHNGFVSYDDYDYIASNPLVRQGLSWHGIGHAFTSFDQSNWFPLEWISLMGTSQLFGPGPFAYHLTNLILHVFNVLLLFLLLQKATGRTTRAGVVAALFAVFPLNVEAVAWATERKSVLSVFFLLLALCAYGWYVRKPGRVRYAAVAAAFALGLMTKAWLVTFPFALLLLDYWPLERFGTQEYGSSPKEERPGLGHLVVEKIPLFLMSAGGMFMAVDAARSGDAFSISAAHAPFGLRVENALWSYLAYVLKGVWPVRLAIIYPFPEHFFAVWKMACAGAFLAGITALVWWARSKRYLLVGWFWYLGLLFPTIGLIQTGTQSMADRWAYISFLGLFVAAVWGLADWAAKLRVSRSAVGALAGAVIVAYACVAYVQNGYWRDSFTLYAHAIQVTRDNGPVRVNLGVEYERLGRPDLALQQYRQAVVDMPSLGVAHFNLARMLDERQQPLEAAAEYNLAISNTGVAHEIADAHIGLGKIYAEMNLPDKAITEFTAALAANPEAVYALLDRGMIEFRQGDLEGARKDFSRSVEITATPGTWFMLGVILEQEKNVPAATRAFEAALKMNPNFNEAKSHLELLRQQQSH